MIYNHFLARKVETKITILNNDLYVTIAFINNSQWHHKLLVTSSDLNRLCLQNFSNLLKFCYFKKPTTRTWKILSYFIDTDKSKFILNCKQGHKL